MWIRLLHGLPGDTTDAMQRSRLRAIDDMEGRYPAEYIGRV
jgi:hypothetical protein